MLESNPSAAPVTVQQGRANTAARCVCPCTVGKAINSSLAW